MRRITLAVSVALAASIAGCGVDVEPAGRPQPQQQPPPSPKDELNFAATKSFLLRGEEERQALVECWQDIGKRSRNKKLSADRLKQLEGMRGKFMPTVSLTAGDIGIMRYPPGDSDWRDLRLRSLRVSQVVNGSEAIAAWSTERLVWLRGFSLSGTADGDVVTIPIPVRVAGTKQYVTVIGGTKTVILIEPCDLNPVTMSDAGEEVRTESKAKKKKPKK